MPKYRNDLTAERVRELFSYDPETGELRWKVSRRGVPCGSIAGFINGKGYRRVCVDNVMYMGHRLAWLYVHGVWPEDELDHRNGVRSDNWINNLREATTAQNHQNQAPGRANTSGFLGVSWHRKEQKWSASIQVDRRRKFLGRFTGPESAAAAYAEAKANIHSFQPTLRPAPQPKDAS